MSAAPTTAPAPIASAVGDGWHAVCLASELALGAHHRVDVEGRPLVLFRTQAPTNASSSLGATSSTDDAISPCALADGSRVWAMDRVCYHMGGPLEQGDIEDMGSVGGIVVTCPWHRYRIGLAGGEGLYQSAPGVWKSKGVRQRVHHVRAVEVNSQLQLQVKLTAGAELASDSYCDPAKYRALQERLNKAPANITLNTAGWQQQQQQHQPMGRGAGGMPGGYVRSGHLFAANRAAAGGAQPVVPGSSSSANPYAGSR